MAESGFPTVREDVPALRELRPVHTCGLEAMLNTITRQTAPRSQASGWAAATLGVMVFGVVVLVVGVWRLRNLPHTGLELDYWHDLLTIVPFGVAGAVLLDRRPDLPFGWLLAGGCAIHVLGLVFVVPAAVALASGNTGPLVRWGVTGGSLLFLQLPIQGLVNVRFPSGRPATRRGRGLEAAIVVGAALVTVAGVLGATAFRGTSPALANLRHPLTGGTAVGEVADAIGVLTPIVVLLTLAAGVGVVIRFFRAQGLERQQLKWRAAHVLFAIALFPLAVTIGVGPFDPLDNVLFVLTLAIPVLRYRLWVIDTILRRSVSYGLVTVLLAIVYLAVTLAGSSLVSERVGALFAALGVAAAFAPLRLRVQRLVDRMFYGDRSEPYRTLSDLGRRLSGAAAPGEMLPGIVGAVAESLRLPYVAIERCGDGPALAVVGQPSATTDRWPLTHEGQLKGFLVASPRRGEEGFDDRDRQLLDDVARHAGIAVHAEGLTADLLLSRQRLVTAREEERRRLRRELHDELGPTLTGVGLNLDAARARLKADPAAADLLLADAKRASAQAIADLRRLVYGLRPPALDDLGLVGAIRAQAERLCAGAGMTLSLESGDLPDLAAAVEVAAYRAAVEAVTNVVRHGEGQSCSIRLQLVEPGRLRLEVENDGPSGQGIQVTQAGNGWVPGVGLTAMRERAEELGGTISAGPRDGGGARVLVEFPPVEAER